MQGIRTRRATQSPVWPKLISLIAQIMVARDGTCSMFAQRHEKGPTVSPSPLAPFRHEMFRTIWIASLASNFGGLVQAVGAAWMMTTLSTSADIIALVQASTTLPIMLFSLVSGALADNFDRRRIMLTAQSFMLVVSVALTVCAWMGVLTP